MTDKLAMITGASEGIGRAFAQRLAGDGYRITAVARNEARLDELVASLGAGHKAIVADLGQPEGLARVRAELIATHHHLLVNNAGYAIFGRFPELPLAQHAELVRVNVDAVVALAHAFLGQARAGDALVNLSSCLAFVPIPSAGLYAATKAFVSVFSECLWYEQKSRDVYVMGLHPGPTATEFQKRSGAGRHEPPAALLQTPDQLVQQAMTALQARREPTVIAGTRLNRALTLVSRLRSRRSVLQQMGRLFPE